MKPKIERTVRQTGPEAYYAVVRRDGVDLSACPLPHFSKRAAQSCADSQKIPERKR